MPLMDIAQISLNCLAEILDKAMGLAVITALENIKQFEGDSFQISLFFFHLNVSPQRLHARPCMIYLSCGVQTHESVQSGRKFVGTSINVMEECCIFDFGCSVCLPLHV